MDQKDTLPTDQNQTIYPDPGKELLATTGLNARNIELVTDISQKTRILATKETTNPRRYAAWQKYIHDTSVVLFLTMSVVTSGVHILQGKVAHSLCNNKPNYPSCMRSSTHPLIESDYGFSMEGFGFLEYSFALLLIHALVWLVVFGGSAFALNLLTKKPAYYEYSVNQFLDETITALDELTKPEAAVLNKLEASELEPLVDIIDGLDFTKAEAPSKLNLKRMYILEKLHTLTK